MFLIAMSDSESLSDYALSHIDELQGEGIREEIFDVLDREAENSESLEVSSILQQFRFA